MGTATTTQTLDQSRRRQSSSASLICCNSIRQTSRPSVELRADHSCQKCCLTDNIFMSDLQVNNACALLMCVQACSTSTAVPLALTDWLSATVQGLILLCICRASNTCAKWHHCFRAARSLWCITRHAHRHVQVSLSGSGSHERLGSWRLASN